MNIGAFQESHSHTMKTGMLLTYSLAYSSLSLIARRVWKCRSAHISRNEGVLLATAKKVNGSDKSSGAIAAIRVFTVGAIHHFAVHCECSGARSGTQYAGTTCSGDWYSTAATPYVSQRNTIQRRTVDSNTNAAMNKRTYRVAPKKWSAPTELSVNHAYWRIPKPAHEIRFCRRINVSSKHCNIISCY